MTDTILQSMALNSAHELEFNDSTNLSFHNHCMSLERFLHFWEKKLPRST